MKSSNLIKNLAPTLLHIPSLKYCPHNLTKYEGKQNSKIPIFQLFMKLGKIQKSQYSIYIFHELENNKKPNYSNTKNPNFQSFSELGESLKYSLTPIFKNPHFKSKDELSYTVENNGNLHKIRLVTFQT